MNVNPHNSSSKPVEVRSGPEFTSAQPPSTARPPTALEQVNPEPRRSLLDIAPTPLHQKLFFGLDAANNPIVDLHDPEFISCGAEHLVYALPKHPKLVVKLNVGDVLFGYYTDVLGRTPPRDIPPPAVRVAVENQRLASLADYFPSHSIPGQRSTCIDLTISKLLLSALIESRGGHRDLRMRVGVTAQQVAPEAHQPGRRDLTVGCAEIDSPPREAYTAVTNRYIYGAEQTTMPLAMRFVQPGLWSNGFMELLNRDFAFRRVVRDFVERAARYMNETGEVIDILGSDNVVFAPTPQGWRYKMVDAVFPVTKLRDCAYAACEQIRATDTLDPHRKLDLRNYLNIVRAVNFLAEHTAVQDRVNPIPEALYVSPSSLLRHLSF